MFTIGIDIGTTNCKVCLFQAPTFELIDHYSFRTPKIIEGEHTDFDAALIWKGVVYGLNKIMTAHAEVMMVSAVAVASVGESGVLLDKHDNITGPVLTWYDTRPKSQLENILSVLSNEQIYEIAGIPAHSNYSLNKIKWLQENIPCAAQGESWLCLAEYIAFKLSGVKRAEYSLASRTMALNLDGKDWDRSLIEKAGVSPSLFSPLTQAGTTIGNVTEEVAQLTGLSSRTLVAIAGHDHMSGSVAVGLNHEDSILNSTGTTEGLLVVTKQSNTSQAFYDARVSNGLHVLPGMSTLYASLPSAGYAIEWFRTLFELDMPAFLRLVDALNDEREQQSESNLDGIFIPHLRGSGPPQRATWSKALLYGMDDKSRPVDILRFIFVGLCFELKNLLDTYESLTQKHYPVVNVIGAACKNPYWLQLKATILNRDIVACNVEEAVSKGAAMLAAKAAGLSLDNVDVATDAMTTRFSPDPRQLAHYQALYSQFYKPLYESKMLSERQRYGEGK